MKTKKRDAFASLKTYHYSAPKNSFVYAPAFMDSCHESGSLSASGKANSDSLYNNRQASSTLIDRLDPLGAMREHTTVSGQRKILLQRNISHSNERSSILYYNYYLLTSTLYYDWETPGKVVGICNFTQENDCASVDTDPNSGLTAYLLLTREGVQAFTEPSFILSCALPGTEERLNVTVSPARDFVSTKNNYQIEKINRP